MKWSLSCLWVMRIYGLNGHSRAGLEEKGCPPAGGTLWEPETLFFSLCREEYSASGMAHYGRIYHHCWGLIWEKDS